MVVLHVNTNPADLDSEPALPQPSSITTNGSNNLNDQLSRPRLNPIQALFHDAINNIQQSYRPLLIAQLLSLLLASSGAANASLHFECNLSAPTIQAGLVYFILMFHLFAIPRDVYTGANTAEESQEESVQIESERERQQEHPHEETNPPFLLFNRIPIYAPIRLYALMAFLDVEANYLTYLSFRYTTLTSVSLLDALAIPSAMLCSRLILRRRYSGIHCIGAIICIVGVTVNVFGDYTNHDGNQNEEGDDDGGHESIKDGTYPLKLRGDALAIVGALLYGLNDTLTERIVKGHDVKEYLGVMGFFGFIICFIQGILTERQAIQDFFQTDEQECRPGKGWVLLAASSVLGAISYIGMSKFLVKSEAALLNLSLLTGDLWAALFSVVAEKILPSSHFWISLVLVVVGVFVYEMAPSPMRSYERTVG
jgi:solute carrier family 35 protein F1/2